jgi:hypothetical protein
MAPPKSPLSSPAERLLLLELQWLWRHHNLQLGRLLLFGLTSCVTNTVATNTVATNTVATKSFRQYLCTGIAATVHLCVVHFGFGVVICRDRGRSQDNALKNYLVVGLLGDMNG